MLQLVKKQVENSIISLKKERSGLEICSSIMPSIVWNCHAKIKTAAWVYQKESYWDMLLRKF